MSLTIVEAKAEVSSSSCLAAGALDLEIANPVTLRQATCAGCISLK